MRLQISILSGLLLGIMVFGFTACTSSTLVQDWKDPAVKLEKRLKAVREAAKTNPL